MMKDPLNKEILEEIGLTVDQQKRVMDQDTRSHLTFNDKNIRYSSTGIVTVTPQDVIFDPASNKNMMMHLFNHFVAKIEDEDGVYVSNYYDIPAENGKGSSIEAIVDGKKVRTNNYVNESLKYVDLIKTLNGRDASELAQFDSAPVEDKIGSRRTTRRKKVF